MNSKIISFLRYVSVTAIFCLIAMAANAQSVMTNADIVTLLDGGMSEEVILEAIASASAHKFDTSAKALVNLKNKGASSGVLKAMLNPRSASAAPVTRSASGSKPVSRSVISEDSRNPEVVTVVVAGQEQQMQYLVPNMRTAARAFGFGGVATYAALPGSKAQLRLPNDEIEFIISVPKNAQPQGYMTLANFAVRNNGTREVITGGGYMSYSTGIHRDRVVPTTHSALSDQTGAREGFVLYSVKPERRLVSGEYALVLYTAEVKVIGFFGHSTNSFFDFGVD